MNERLGCALLATCLHPPNTFRQSQPRPLARPDDRLPVGCKEAELSPEYERLLDTRAAAVVLGLSYRTLEDLRWRGRSPRYLRLSRNCIRYRHSDLIEWAERRAVHSTTEAHFKPLPK